MQHATIQITISLHTSALGTASTCILVYESVINTDLSNLLLFLQPNFNAHFMNFYKMFGFIYLYKHCIFLFFLEL